MIIKIVGRFAAQNERTIKRIRTMNIKNTLKKAVSLLSGLVLLTSLANNALANQSDDVVLYLNDSLGSAIAAFDEAGELCWQESYTPYGQKTVLEDSFTPEGCGTISEERGFTGHTEDFKTDLVYMQQRYYDPTIGRFLSIDPVGPLVGDPGSINRYSYARNTPYVYIDPDGRWVEDLIIGIPSLALGAASFIENVRSGNWLDAAVDTIGMATDVVAIATPGVPGGVGLGIKAGRVADAAVDAKAIGNASSESSKFYHYTDKAGAKGIAESGVIKPDAKGRVYITEEKLPASEVNNALFMGQGGTKGSHRVEIELKSNSNLSSGTQPNELIHNGAIRDPRNANLNVMENEF